MNWGRWAGHFVMFGSILLTIAVFLVVKLWRKSSQRRSPLGGRADVGRLPGQALLNRIREHDDEVGRAIFLSMLAAPLMFMVWASMRLDWARVRWGFGEWLFVAGGVMLFSWGLVDYVRHYNKRERYKDGWVAERVTGQQLNRLVAQGCMVLHDLPAEVGNIDHVVVAPRGVYAVETKSFRKPKDVTDDRNHPGHKVMYDGTRLRFPDFVTAKPMEQSTRQAVSGDRGIGRTRLLWHPGRAQARFYGRRGATGSLTDHICTSHNMACGGSWSTDKQTKSFPPGACHPRS